MVDSRVGARERARTENPSVLDPGRKIHGVDIGVEAELLQAAPNVARVIRDRVAVVEAFEYLVDAFPVARRGRGRVDADCRAQAPDRVIPVGVLKRVRCPLYGRARAAIPEA